FRVLERAHGEGLDSGADPLRGIAMGARGCDGLDLAADDLAEDPGDEIGLAVEVFVHRAGGQAGLGGDGRHGQTGDAVAGQHSGRGLHDQCGLRVEPGLYGRGSAVHHARSEARIHFFTQGGARPYGRSHERQSRIRRPAGTASSDDAMSARGGVPARLTVVDEIFLRTHRGLGTPIALQGLWRTSDRVEVELLEDLHARLRRGPLGRRVVRARVPGARRSWRPTVRAHPLDLHGEIAASDVLGWADTLGADLDPEYAPGWRLSSAPLDDGGTVIALTCSHVLAD